GSAVWKAPPLAPEDAVPRDGVVRIEPSLGLPSITVVEDAHDASLDLQVFPACADVAQRAHVVVVGEHVVLADGEPERAELREQLEQLIATYPVAGQRVISGQMPHRVLGDQRGDDLEVTIPER